MDWKGRCFVFCTTQWMQRHNIQTGGYKLEKLFSGDQVVGPRSLHTTKSIAQIFWGVVFNVSYHLFIFCCGSDGM